MADQIDKPEEPETPETAPETPVTPETLDFGGRKVPIVDPSLKDLHGDWLNLTRHSQTLNQQLAEAQQQIARYEEFLNQMLANEQTEQVTPAQLDDPSALVQQLTQQAIAPLQQELDALKTQQEIARQLESVAQRPDFNDLKPAMEQILEAQPHLADLPNAVEVLYTMARGQTAKAPDELLSDEAFRQKLLQDENIRNAILTQHAQGVQAQSPPPVIGNQAGLPTTSPPETPKTLSEATTAFLRRHGLNT